MVAALGNCGGTGPSVRPKPVQTLPPGLVKVPDVVGERAGSACTVVTAVGLTCGRNETRASSAVPQGDVIGTSPSAGQEVASRSEVSFVVSGDDASVLVPDVVGDTGDVAGSTLGSLGLTSATTCQMRTSPTQDGTVVSQDPEAGNAVLAGSTITIRIARASC